MTKTELKKIFTELSTWIVSGYGSTLVDPADHISKKFKQALRSVGAEESKRFHSLRHTFAVRRIVEKVPIFKIQKMMGHSSIATTEGYLKLDLKRLERDFPTIVYNPSKSAFRDTPLSHFPHLNGEGYFKPQEKYPSGFLLLRYTNQFNLNYFILN